METLGGKAAVALSGARMRRRVVAGDEEKPDVSERGALGRARMIRRVVAGEEENLVMSEKRGDGGRVRSTLSP